MKKILLASTVLAGLAFVAAAPARAEDPALQLGVSGYIVGYGVYTDQDEPAGTEYRKFDFRKYTEVDFTGEVALDNGVTAGAEIVTLMNRADGGSTIQESYFYLSNQYGRVNMGEEYGIAALLQVVPPSVDSEIDGSDPTIGTFAAATGGTLTYIQNDFQFTNRFTYITPVFNGFQAGVSYAPSANAADQAGIAASLVSNTVGTDLEDAWEAAAHYQGSFDAIDVAVGAGYGHASQEVESAGEDDRKVWNAGATIGWNDIDFGASYLTTNNDLDNNGDIDTWVLGANYTMGAYVLGASYLNRQSENGAGTPDTEIDRWTVGAIYEWGPGMTTRGSVQFQNADDVGGVTTADADGTQISIGTMLNF